MGYRGPVGMEAFAADDAEAALEAPAGAFLLLVLDEIGYLPCDNRSADLLYNIISRRHENKSTIVTTNLPFKQ